MTEGFSAAQALELVADPTTTGALLQFIAVQHKELWPAIARHQNCYPGLLDWMDARSAVPLKPGAAPVAAIVPVRGASKTGALVGGIIVMLIGVAAVAYEITAYFSNSGILTAFVFGAIPGVHPEFASSWADNWAKYVLAIGIGFSTVWVGLGVVIMVGARAHLTGVIVTTLICACAFLLAPSLEFIIHDLLAYGQSSFWGAVQPLLLVIALVIIAIASRRGYLNTGPRIWAIVLLIATVVSGLPVLYFDFWNPNGSGNLAYLPFCAAWIVVVATAGQKAPVDDLPLAAPPGPVPPYIWKDPVTTVPLNRRC